MVWVNKLASAYYVIIRRKSLLDWIFCDSFSTTIEINNINYDVDIDENQIFNILYANNFRLVSDINGKIIFEKK